MLPGEPMDLFDTWMGDVLRAGLPEPTAMVLATVSADQRPRARMVLLKSSGPEGFTFYTNRTSRKASDLAEVPRGVPAVPLVRAAPAGDHRGPGNAAVDRRERAVLPQPAARLPAWRLGQPAVDRAGLPGRARGPVRRAGARAGRRARRCRCRSSGAATGSARSGWSSGRAGSAGCTTDSGTPGRASVAGGPPGPLTAPGA